MKKVKNEIFNYDLKGLEKFLNTTDAKRTLSNITKQDENVNLLTKKFLKKSKEIKHQCFKKFKIKKSDNKEIEELFNKRKLLKQQTGKESKKNLMRLRKIWLINSLKICME